MSKGYWDYIEHCPELGDGASIWHHAKYDMFVLFFKNYIFVDKIKEAAISLAISVLKPELRYELIDEWPDNREDEKKIKCYKSHPLVHFMASLRGTKYYCTEGAALHEFLSRYNMVEEN